MILLKWKESNKISSSVSGKSYQLLLLLLVRRRRRRLLLLFFFFFIISNVLHLAAWGVSARLLERVREVSVRSI